MKVVFTPRAERDLAHHLSYGIQRFGHAVALRTLQRLESFLDPFLVSYPRTATVHPEINAPRDLGTKDAVRDLLPDRAGS